MKRSGPVLLADDEESEVEIFRLAVKRAGLSPEFVVARDGVEVVEHLEKTTGGKSEHPLPSLILLDLKMPRMSGFEVLEWLASQPHFKDLPVLILSSSTADSDMQKARRLGAREYFVKPTGLDDLVKIVHEIHQRYLDADKHPSTGLARRD